MSVVQSHELSYVSDIANHSNPRMSRVLPLSGNQSVVLNTGASASEVQFELPNKVFNLARSTLDFKMSVAVSTGTTFNRLFTLGQTAIQRITLATREGVSLMDLRDCDKYTRAVAPVATRLVDMLNKPNNLGAVTQAASDAKGKGHNIFRSNAAATATVAAAFLPNGTRVGAGGAAEAPDISYTEPQYTTATSVDGILAMSYSIPLNELYHSICSVDRVMYFGQSLLMTVYFNGTGKIGFNGASATTYGTPLVLASAVTVSDMKMYMAVETNPALIAAITQKVQSEGLQVVIPYVHGYKFSSPSGTSSNVSQRLNAGHGQRLLNTYHAVYHATDSSSTSQDISNVAAAKVVSFQTSLDNQYLQEYIPQCALAEDYELLQPVLKGSLIQSANMYQHNKVWIDSWRKGRSCDWRDTDTMIDGLPLESERIWSIEQTNHATPAAYLQYSWFVCQRTLSIDPSGIISVQ